MRAPFAGIGLQYWKVWSAGAISNLGDGITLTAGPLLAATLTRDPVLVAGVAFAQRLPWLIFPLISGALVDRLDRRRVMGYVDVLRSALIGILGIAVLLDLVSLPLMYVVFFLMGTLETLFDNASQAIIPSVVARGNLEKANGRLYAAEIVANQFAGPPLGGFLFGVAVAVPFLLDAGTFAAAAALILALRGKFRPARDEGAPPTTLVTEIGEGIRWLYDHRLLRILAVLLGIMNMTFTAADAILVLFAQEILGLGAVGFGVLLTAGAIGGLLGSLIANRLVGLFGSGRTLFLCVLLEGVALGAVAMTDNAFIVGAMFALVGLIAVAWNVITVSLRQAIVPERIFGRVNSVYRLLGWGGMSIGALVGGFLARVFGLTAPFWFGAGLLIALAFAALPFLDNRVIAGARAGSERG